MNPTIVNPDNQQPVTNGFEPNPAVVQQPSVPIENRPLKVRRSIVQWVLILCAVISLFISISSLAQYLSAKNIEAHSQYTTGMVTNRYIKTDKTFQPKLDNYYYSYTYFVQYTFNPVSSSRQYNATYGISQQDYSDLHKGSSIRVYYDTQNPNVQAVAGYQSTTGSLASVFIVSIIIFVCFLVAYIVLRKRSKRLTKL